jgi:hypothetical protein
MELLIMLKVTSGAKSGQVGKLVPCCIVIQVRDSEMHQYKLAGARQRDRRRKPILSRRYPQPGIRIPPAARPVDGGEDPSAVRTPAPFATSSRRGIPWPAAWSNSPRYGGSATFEHLGARVPPFFRSVQPAKIGPDGHISFFEPSPVSGHF